MPDAEADIVEAVNACRARYDHVFTTGGIGPTHDDITSACVAKAFGVPFGRHPEAERRLLAYYPPEKVNAGADEDGRHARGCRADRQPGQRRTRLHASSNVHVLPGVPSILQAMFAGLKSRLQGGEVVRSRTITWSARRATWRWRSARSRPTARGRDRQLSVHAPGQLRHQPRPAQHRRGRDRRRRPTRSWPRRASAGSRCWTCSERARAPLQRGHVTAPAWRNR